MMNITFGKKQHFDKRQHFVSFLTDLSIDIFTSKDT